jgi:hypothetical protein
MLTPMFLSVGSTTATVKRYGQGSYLHGRWVDGAETTFTIKANIQPHTVKNISDTTAEGNKSKKAIKVFTTTTLRMTQEGTALQNGDKISCTSIFVSSNLLNPCLSFTNEVKAKEEKHSEDSTEGTYEDEDEQEEEQFGQVFGA